MHILKITNVLFLLSDCGKHTATLSDGFPIGADNVSFIGGSVETARPTIRPLSLASLATLETLTGFTQKGAQLFITLSGDVAEVRQEAYKLHNSGLAELPESYDDEKGESTVTLSSNVYRITKLVRADKLNRMTARHGFGVRALIRGGTIDRMAKRTTTRLIRSLRTAACGSSRVTYAPTYSAPSGKGGGERETWGVSAAMASIAALGERVLAAHEHSTARA